jgi:polo-like kinase 1
MKDSQRGSSIKAGVTNTKTLPNGFLLSKEKISFQRSEIFVKKWIDNSSTSGMGYILSNGSAGVFFNDSTKLIMDPK